MPVSVWKGQANAVASRMRGMPVEQVQRALMDIREESVTARVRWVVTDQQLLEAAQIISGGSTKFRWK